MGRVPDELLELGAEFLDVADVGPDGAVVEGTDGRAGAASGDVVNGVEVLFPSLALHYAVAELVDPAGGLPAGRALAAGVVGVEAGRHNVRVRDGHRLDHDDDDDCGSN